MEKTACLFNIQKFSLHDGPGIRTVVFFKGCPLRCDWCANPESQNKQPERMNDEQNTLVGKDYTLTQVMEEVLKDQVFYEESGGGVTLSGGEVLMHVPFALALLKELKKQGIHTACETSGYTQPKTFQSLLAYTDLLYMDLKHYDSSKHKLGTGVGNERILTNLKQAVDCGQPLIVRIPIIPNYNDQAKDAYQFGQLLQQLGVKTVEILPFHQFGEKKYTYLNREYALTGVSQLHTEDLTFFKDILNTYDLTCSIR